MKATGEVMAIDRTFGAALNKALRSMEQKGSGPTAEEASWDGELAAISARGGKGLKEFLRPSDSRLWRLLAAMRRGVSADAVHEATGITRWFFAEFERLISIEHRVREAGRTLIGPHRSDLVAVWRAKGMPAADCSTGEQKALLISLILANARALAGSLGAPPVLMLDEVAAHLDAGRRAALYDEICGLGAQAFMTGTGPELFTDLGSRAQYVEVAEVNGTSVLTERSAP
jgi:hypothetical protein